MKKLLYVGIVLYILMFVLNALNAVPIADDFCNQYLAQKSGAWDYVVYNYLNWTGRFLTLLAMGLTSNIIPIENQNIVSGLLALLFIVFLYQFSYLLNRESRVRSDQYFILALLAAVTWFSYRQMLGRIVIWYTGGMVYMLCYIFVPLFFLEFIKCYRAKKYSMLLLTYSVLLANSVEIIPPAIIIFMASYIYLNGELSKKESVKYFLIVSSVITLASVPLFLAPGNFARARTISSGDGLSFLSVFSSYYDVVKVFLYSAKNSIFMAIPVALLSTLFLSDASREYRRMLGWCFVAAAIGSSLPMAFASAHNGARPASLFVFLTTFGVFGIFSSFKLRPRFEKHKTLAATALFALTGLAISYDFIRGMKLRDHFVKRDTYLQELMNRDEDLVVESFKGKVPRSLNNHDLKKDKGHWINVCVANHYKVKSIRTENK
ncbi:MAG TPA: DUF6056 family protein [Bacteriovoracaceae bacterium]|nr:DUF6056 family protein [Bacteriovoracaceae bacterium]